MVSDYSIRTCTIISTMEDLSLHILDIAENAIRAESQTIEIKILEDEIKDQVTIIIKDDGKGMDKETVKKVFDPFFTTKNGKKVGLGVSLLYQAARQAGGDLTIDSKKGEGTKIKALFKLSHPDMKPMGNILETMATLITGNPTIRFIYDYKKGNDTFHFDSQK